MKDYFLMILNECAPENGFAQEAIELALLENRVMLTGNKEADVKAIMGIYDEIIEAYRSFQARDEMNFIIESNFGVPANELTTGL